jgi:rubrerythrin
MSNPTKPADMGANRTGIATAPVESKKTVEGARAGSPAPDTEPLSLETLRLEASRKVEPVGTMPPPASVKGAAKAAVSAVKGKHPMVFLDLLGERLAFERTGTRLYDALLIKQQAAHEHSGGPELAELERIRNDELRHFVMVKEALESLGADPTTVTPSADIAGVAAMGWVQVIADPRTTLTEALKVMLTAELTDSDAWLLLTDMAARLGHKEMAASFQMALADEEEHLARVRGWVAAAVDQQAGLEPMVMGAPAAVGAPGLQPG